MAKGQFDAGAGGASFEAERRPNSARVFLPLTREERRALELYASRAGLPMSQVLVHLTSGFLAQIKSGGDPLGRLTESA